MATPLKKVAELATITSGFSAKPEERKKSGHYLLLGGRNIRDGKLVTTDSDSYVGEIGRESFRRAIAKPGDAIVSTLFDRRKLYLYDKDDVRLHHLVPAMTRPIFCTKWSVSVTPC